MRRNIAKVLCTISSFIIIICVLFTSLEIRAFDMNFFQKEYLKMDTAKTVKMQTSDLIEVTEHLLEYIKGNEDNLRIEAKIGSQTQNVFNKREREHMVDVRDMFLFARTARNIAALCAIAMILLCVLLARRHSLALFAKSYIRAQVVFLIIGVGLAIWITLDFDSFWTNFHLLLFTNDLWLLDPKTDIMINMFDIQFFYDLVAAIATLFAGICAFLTASCAAYLIYFKKYKNSPINIKKQNK